MARTKNTHKQIKVTVTIDSYKKILELAEDQGLNKAEYLRRLADAKIDDIRKPREPIPYKTEVRVDKDWCYEINMIRYNLNQAVQEMYRKGALIELKSLQYILDSLEELNDNVCSSVKN